MRSQVCDMIEPPGHKTPLFHLQDAQRPPPDFKKKTHLPILPCSDTDWRIPPT